jgi:hypothetical protein
MVALIGSRNCLKSKQENFRNASNQRPTTARNHQDLTYWLTRPETEKRLVET